MSVNEFLDLISKISPLFIIKLFLLVALFSYVLFAWVVLRQEKFMSQVVEVPISPVLTLLVAVHFWAAVGLFILALFIL